MKSEYREKKKKKHDSRIQSKFCANSTVYLQTLQLDVWKTFVTVWARA